MSLAAVACGGSELEHKDLGNTTASFDPSDRTPLVTSDSVLDPFVAGHWVGRAEDLFSPPGPDGARLPYTFPSGSQQITLDLSLTGAMQTSAAQPTGHITFGEGIVPEPAAGVVYPPGIHPSTPASLTAAPPIEGFTYTVDSPGAFSSDAGALSIIYYAGEAYTDWCPLQPSNYEFGKYDCITPGPEPSTLPPTGWCAEQDPTTFIHYDCRFRWLCQACSCSAAGCQVTYGYGDGIELLLMRSGADLLGTFVSALFDYGSGTEYLPVGNVRFQRQPQ